MQIEVFRWRSLGVGLLLLWVGLSGSSDAQSPDGAADAAPPVVPSAEDGTVTGETGAADSGLGVAVPYSSLFRETGAPLIGTTSVLAPPRGISVSPSVGNLSSNFHLGLLDFGRGIFTRAPSTENAHLKLGPLFFHLDALTGSIFYREGHQGDQHFSDWGSLIDLQFSLAMRLGEGGALGMRGHLYYWPFENRVDLLSSAAFDFGLGLVNSLDAQIAYSLKVGDVTFGDDFRAFQSGFLGSSRSNLAEIRAVAGTEGTEGGYQFGPSNRESRRDFVTLSNVVSALTRKDLGEWQFTGRAFHENFWYFSDGGSALPSARDQASARIESVRENMRFKPFLSYTIASVEGVGGVDETLWAGINGPITDQLLLDMRAGYFFGTGRGRHSTALGLIGLYHDAGPYTRQSFTAERTLTELNDAIVDRADYRITQILGPAITAELFASYLRFESNAARTLSGREERLGSLIKYDSKGKFGAHLLAMYFKSVVDHDEADGYSARVGVSYRFTDSIYAEAAYRYRHAESAARKLDGSEHFAFLTVRKTFR